MKPPVRSKPSADSHRTTKGRQKRSRNDEVEDDRRTKRRISRPDHAETEERVERRATNHREINNDTSEEDGGVIQSDEIRQLMSDLLKSKCRLYRVTPMSLGEVNRNTIKSWSKTLQLALIQNNKYQCTNKDWQYKVEFQIINGLAKFPSDANALEFKIYRKETTWEFVGEDADDGNFSVACHALFVAREARRRKPSHQVHLPLLMINGPESIFKAVRVSIEQLFDCIIFPMDDITSSEIKIITGRYLMTTWLDEDGVLDKNSLLTFYFAVEKSEHLQFDHEGSVPLKVFEEIMTGFGNEPFHATNKDATLMWFDFFNILNTPVIMDFYTPTCKITFKHFAITNRGSIKVKNPTIKACFDLLASLTWCAEGGTSKPHQRR